MTIILKNLKLAYFRELQVLKLFFRGKRNIEISEKLDINQKKL